MVDGAVDVDVTGRMVASVFCGVVASSVADICVVGS